MGQTIACTTPIINAILRGSTCGLGSMFPYLWTNWCTWVPQICWYVEFNHVFLFLRNQIFKTPLKLSFQMASGCVPVEKVKEIIKKKKKSPNDFSKMNRIWFVNHRSRCLCWFWRCASSDQRERSIFTNWYYVIWIGQLWRPKYSKRLHINCTFHSMDSRKFTAWVSLTVMFTNI